MQPRTLLPALGLALSALPVQSMAGINLYEQGDSRLAVSGDFRLRMEQDWDSRAGNGTEREDRLRLRTRARVKIDWAIDANWGAVLRLRTGSEDSQQSPHVTFYDFDDNPTGSSDLNADLWYGRFQSGGWNVTAGRNSFNVWKQNEFMLDDDVTAPGLGVTYSHGLGDGKISYRGGLGSLPVGLTETSGQFASAQAVFDVNSDGTGWTVAAGYFGVDADATNTNGMSLLTGNGGRDYQTGFLQFQWRTEIEGQSLKIGADVGENFENYDNEPAGSFSKFHEDDTGFYSFFVNYGSSKDKGDWLFGYYYLNADALAYSSSYAGDDWVRWGNANQTRATNLKGSEFRVIYTLAPNMNLTTRVYFVEATELLNPGDVAKEDGNRARIDFNIKF